MADTETNTMLDSVKLALAITVDSYDAELQDLINAALYDLKTNGVDALMAVSSLLSARMAFSA